MLRLADLRSVLPCDATVLDLGCGPGWPAVPLSPHVARITAVDASNLAVSLISDAIRARDIGNVDVRQGDAADLPFEDDTFDAVIASDLMDVVQSPSRVAREMFRVLKSGGRFVSRVQNFARVLGCAEQCHRCFQIDGDEGTYTVHYASLSPAHSLDLRFRLDMQRVLGAAARIAQGTLDVGRDMVLKELQALRPAIQNEVHLYRAPEFVPGTAAGPFRAAGFTELTVVGLNCDACTAFADELIKPRGHRPVLRRLAHGRTQAAALGVLVPGIHDHHLGLTGLGVGRHEVERGLDPTRERTAAEDATQETFLKLANQAGHIRKNPAAWLHACAMNAARDRYRCLAGSSCVPGGSAGPARNPTGRPASRITCG